MTARYDTRRGRRALILDIPYTRADGTPGRYRRDATAATLAAARLEERRIRDYLAEHGQPPSASPLAPATLTAEPVATGPTFGDVVEEYRRDFVPAQLKVTSRRGYESVIQAHFLPRFAKLPIVAVDGRAAQDLDVELGRDRGLARSTRNNIQIVLRSILRFAEQRGYLPAMPRGLPPLKVPPSSVLTIPSDEEVERLLGDSTPTQRRAFLLMARAGLRPNEVRGLRVGDLDLTSESSGFVVVRRGVSFHEEHTPKTGEREIPIVGDLLAELWPLAGSPRDRLVALTERGEPWGQWGLDTAFDRVAERIGLEGHTLYSLRHFAITSWLRAGIPVHVVQRMAGHTNLSTTERYTHLLRSDLADAARRLIAASRPPQDCQSRA